MSARRPSALRLVHAAFVVALIAVAGIPLWSIYQDPAVIVTGIGALVVGSGIAFASATFRWPAHLVVVATVIAYLVVGVPLAVPSAAIGVVLPSAAGLRDLVTGTATSWSEMLSVDLPLGRYETLLVPALVVLLGATVAGLCLALRARTPGWAILPAVAVLVFGIAFGGSDATAPVASGIALVGLALLWALVSSAVSSWSGAAPGVLSSGARSSMSPRRLVAALVLITVTLGAGGTFVALTPPSTPRQVVRTAAVPPFDPDQYVSPLVAYRNSVRAPAGSETMLTVTGLPDGARVRLATLDDFDGLVFSVGSSPSSGTFARVPSRVPRDAEVGTPAIVRVTVDGYRGVWLPTVGDVSSIGFGSGAHDTTYFLNAATGAAAVRGGVTAGESYTVQTVVPPTASLERLAGATPGETVQPRVRGLPAGLAAAAKSHSAGASTPGARLVALTKWLRGGYVSDSGPSEPFSAAGQTASRLNTLMTTSPMLGDAEQYAPALALLARQVGFPSRVVVGYAPKAGQSALRGRDLTAWVEVEVKGRGWVAVDPNPQPRPVPSRATKPTEAIARPQTVLPPPPPQKNDTALTQNRDGQKTKHDPGPPLWLQIVTAVVRIGGPIALVAGIVTAPLWSIALARLLRRRRRHRADRAAVVVSGAWNEVADAIADSGFEIDRAATRSEIAASVGTPEVTRFAADAERSVFSRQIVTTDDVERFWIDSLAARRSVTAIAESRWERFRFHLTARSLRDSSRARLRSLWHTRGKDDT